MYLGAVQVIVGYGVVLAFEYHLAVLCRDDGHPQSLAGDVADNRVDGDLFEILVFDLGVDEFVVVLQERVERLLPILFFEPVLKKEDNSNKDYEERGDRKELYVYLFHKLVTLFDCHTSMGLKTIPVSEAGNDVFAVFAYLFPQAGDVYVDGSV